MKKLFILLTAFALCTQPILAMETGEKPRKKKSTTSTCAKVLCGLLGGSAAIYGIIQAGQYLRAQHRLQHEWQQMQLDCWDPCLSKPNNVEPVCGHYPPLTVSRYQEVRWEDHWLERVWDNRIEQYRDELNCPDQTQDVQLKIQGCKRLEKKETSDQAALACIAGMEAHDQLITPTIIQQKEELARRAAQREKCLQWAPYLAWKETHHFRLDNGRPCRQWDSPYLSAHYQYNQPQVLDLRKCRILRPSDCSSRPSEVGTVIEFFNGKPSCEKASDPIKKDGDEVPEETVKALIAYRTSNTPETLCGIWRPELEKKNQ